MAQKKYVSLTRLSNFLDNIKAKYSQIGHKHTISDITDYKVDTTLSSTSSNPVANSTIDAEFDAVSDALGALELAIDGKAASSHNHDDRYYTETEIDTKLASKSDATHNHNNDYDAKGSASAVQENLDTVSDALDAHTTNSDIHFTAAERTKLSGIAAGAQVNTVTGVKGSSESTYRTGNINITKANIGLGNVDNTADSAKSVKYATSAGSATSATKATQDASGNVITSTYETKTDASAKLTEAKTYADSAAAQVKNDLLNNAGEAYDTLKELGDLIDDNKDAIDALNDVASGKANAVHTHAISDVSGLQTALDGKAASSHGTHVSFDSTNKPKMDGTAAFGTSSKVARADHVHPTDTSRASKTEFDSHTANTTAHITATERTNWNAAKTHADSAHAPSNAEKNQNAFSNIKVGTTTIAADTTTDTLELVGSNVTITPDATNDKVTIAVASGSTSTAGILKLTNSTSSTSTTTAATPSSVKSAYDLANTAKTNAATAQTRADNAYTLAEGKVDSLSDLGITATADELNYVDGVTSNIQTQLDGKAASSHTHSYAGSSSAGGAATSANKVNSSLTVKLNGGTTEGTNLFTFNGSAEKSVNITPSAIGAATSSHTHDDRYYTESEIDSKLSGKANNSHGNHVPATQTASNKVFLRNDNTWATVTPANIGAAASSHTHTVANITDLTATATELNYMDGVTSNVQAQLDSKASSGHNHIYYGVCSTAADTVAKTVTIDNFSLVTGAMVIVKFTNANSIASPTLNVNGTGAKPICRYGTTAASTGTTTTGWRAGAVQIFVYDGTSWVRDFWENTTYSNVALGHGYGTCSTAEATVAKVVTLSSYALTNGGIVAVKFTYAVPASATMNINSKGAKAIFYRGSAITAGVIKAGDIATFMYNGTQYHLLTVDRDNNTTYSAAGSSLGLVKTGGDVTISSGVITVNDDSHNHTIANVDNLQSSLDSKQTTITGGATTITSSNLTASRALVSNSSGKVAVSTVTSTELGYLDGVTSNVQAQLDSKLSTSGGTISGIITTTDGDVVNRNVTTGGTYFYGGTNFDDGAFIGLYGKDQSNYAGQFRLKAGNGEDFVYLEGTPDGSLRWNGKNVLVHDSVISFTNRAIQGKLPVVNGGTGLMGVTFNNFLVGNGNNTMIQKTPAEVLSMIGAANVSTMTTAEYNALEETNANTLYMLTDAEEEELITVEDIDAICGATV